MRRQKLTNEIAMCTMNLYTIKAALFCQTCSSSKAIDNTFNFIFVKRSGACETCFQTPAERDRRWCNRLAVKKLRYLLSWVI